jgi:hypothetical protein
VSETVEPLATPDAYVVEVVAPGGPPGPPGPPAPVYEQPAQPPEPVPVGALWVDTDAPTPLPGNGFQPVDVLPASPTPGMAVLWSRPGVAPVALVWDGVGWQAQQADLPLLELTAGGALTPAMSYATLQTSQPIQLWVDPHAAQPLPVGAVVDMRMTSPTSGAMFRFQPGVTTVGWNATWRQLVPAPQLTRIYQSAVDVWQVKFSVGPPD